jgi:hypothetical protein
MILANGKVRNRAAARFWDLVSPNHEDIFVTLTAYADESGTHIGPGSDLLTVAGWVAPVDEWEKFCTQWKAVLLDFKVKYFHFREWSNASRVARGKPPTSDFKKNPYKDWDQSKLDDFLFRLAAVAASGNKLIVGGYVPGTLLREEQKNGTVENTASAQELCVGHFFESIATNIKRDKAPWKRLPIAFFFDHSEDVGWKNLVHAGFDRSRQRQRQFRSLRFEHKEDYLPLQAADMAAYRLRQRIERHVQWDFSDTKWPKLDSILFKSIDESYSKLSQSEKEATVRRFFVIPEDATEREIINAINKKRRDTF